MPCRRFVTSHQCRGLIAGLLCLVALVWAAPAGAVAPPPLQPLPEEPGPGPLFAPNEFHTNPLHMALNVFGASTSPGSGRFASVAALYAGEQTRAWNLEGALTNRYSRVSLAASTLVGNGVGTGALFGLATLKIGEQLDCWTLMDTDRFRALPPEWLAAVSDGPGIPIGGLEADIYSRVLTRAYYTSQKALARAARRDVTFTHVINEPERYRGTVMRIDGRILRVNRFDPPVEAEAAGISDLYEAWVFNEAFGTNPFCLVFTVWPEGLSRDLLGQPKINEVVRISFDGFFFKNYRYKSKDRNGTLRETPLVVGRSLVVHPAGDEEPSSAAGNIYLLLYLFVASVVGLIFGIFGLTYWYRRSDRRMQQRLQAHMPEFVLPPPDAMPVLPPAAAPVKRGNGTPSNLPHRPRITFPGAGNRGSAPEGGSPPPDPGPDEGAGA